MKGIYFAVSLFGVILYMEMCGSCSDIIYI